MLGYAVAADTVVAQHDGMAEGIPSQPATTLHKFEDFAATMPSSASLKASTHSMPI